MTSAFAGHGLDGDIVFPTGIYSMARDMYWDTGEMSPGAIIETNGFVPHFRTALIGPPSGTGIIRSNGADASGFTGGLGFNGVGSIFMASGNGATGSTGIGDPADPGQNGSWPAHVLAGASGNGGAGTFAGGAGSNQPNDGIVADSDGSMDAITALRMRMIPDTIAGGEGGGAGGGNGTQHGGGGGAGGGNIVVCAGLYIRAENIAIQARGGAGGAGQGTNCGGGGGGGGGLIAVYAGSLPTPSTLDNSGGPGGASGGGTGHAGAAGSPGAAPLLFVG